MTNHGWQPLWWDDTYASAWDRVKEALRRDWEQTKHDLHLRGGHELNQDVMHTLKQATNREAMPAHERPNGPKIIGSWDDLEGPVAFGYGAHARYGARHTGWNDELEAELRERWGETKDASSHAWSDVKDHVKYGYDYRAKHGAGISRPG
jgi:hypothetical protein